MSGPHEQSARDILETVPLVMRFIRDQVRRRHTGGLSVPQFRTLTFLNRVRSASLSAAANHLGLSLPAMSRLVNGLVKQRLVQRQTVSSNRRQIALTLTTRGRVTLEEARGEIRRQLAGSLKTIPIAEQKVVQRAMEVLHAVFDARVAGALALQKAEL